MYSRGEVRSFLQSSANYWLKEFHFDGLRMDAISNIIFWQGDERRGVNANAVSFVKNMNQKLKKANPGCMLIAEDSTSFKGITGRANQNSLGFDYKWDLGWMHDTLDFLALPVEKRPENYHKLTFSMLYFEDENYLLPLSHDEVVHGKGTIVNKISGTPEERLTQARLLYLYMIMHPGKKLNFMGNELAQWREWDEKRQQDFSLLQDDPRNAAFYQYMKALNHLYLNNPALSEEDYEPAGFEWADCHQEDKLIYAITRKSKKQTLMGVFNFSNIEQPYSVLLPDENKQAKLIFSTNDSSTPEVKLENGSMSLTLPPFTAYVFYVSES